MKTNKEWSRTMAKVTFLSNNRDNFLKKIFYLITLAIIIASTVAPHAYATSNTTDFAISSPYNQAYSIVSINGVIWYAQSVSGSSTNHSIASITSSGIITDYDISSPSIPNFSINSITAGPDDNIWFNGKNGNQVCAGSLNPSTGTVNFYCSGIISYSQPGRIIVGGDGNLWYYAKNAADRNYTYLVYVDPSTGITTTGNTFDSYSNFTGIANGPDGRLWIADSYHKEILREGTTSISGAAGYSIPSLLGSVYPVSLVSGSDNNVWFRSDDRIIKVASGAAFTAYTMPSGITPDSLTSGADGAIWFTSNGVTKKIGRITIAGVVNTHTLPTTVNHLGDITSTPNGAIWFTDNLGIGRLSY